MTLLKSLTDFFAQHGSHQTYWIAYSGGLDSQVLLSLCREIKKSTPIKMNAIHVNHGLNGDANAWSIQCARICKEADIPYHEKCINIKLLPGESLEEVARQKRYAIFQDLLAAGDILLTAHHEDDQAETVLLQLIRGAGVKGLSAMPAFIQRGHIFHARPLLSFSRAMLLKYAQEKQLTYIDDESNRNRVFARNFIRHDILTLLKDRWPTVTETIARSAKHCAEVQSLLDEFAIDLYNRVQGSQLNTLSVSKLNDFSPEKQRLILRTWIYLAGFPMPSLKRLITIQKEVLTAGRDRMPCVSWQHVNLRRYRDDLYLLLNNEEHDSSKVYTWDFRSDLMLPGIGQLRAQAIENAGLSPAVANVSIKFRQGGEEILIPKRGRRPLKKMLQEWHVPPWIRDRIPLLIFEDKLIGVIGYFLDQNYSAKKNECGYLLTLS